MLNASQLISAQIAQHAWNGLGYGIATASAQFNQTGKLSWFNPYAYTNRLSSFKRKAVKGAMMAASFTPNPISNALQYGWAKAAPIVTGFMTPIIEKVISPILKSAESQGLSLRYKADELIALPSSMNLSELALGQDQIRGMVSNTTALSEYATKVYQYADQQAPIVSQFLLEKAEIAYSQILNFAELPSQLITRLAEETGIPAETVSGIMIGIGIGGYAMYYLTSSYYSMTQNVNVNNRNQNRNQNQQNVQVYLLPQQPGQGAAQQHAQPIPAAVVVREGQGPARLN